MKKFLIILTLFLNYAYASSIYTICLCPESDLEKLTQHRKAMIVKDRVITNDQDVQLDHLLQEQAQDIKKNIKSKKFLDNYFNQDNPEGELYLILHQDQILGYIKLFAQDSLCALKSGDMEIMFPVNEMKEELSCNLEDQKNLKLLYMDFSQEKLMHEPDFLDVMKEFVNTKLKPRLMKTFYNFSNTPESQKVFSQVLDGQIKRDDQQANNTHTNSFKYLTAYARFNVRGQTERLMHEIGFVPYAVEFLNNDQLFYLQR